MLPQVEGSYKKGIVSTVIQYGNKEKHYGAYIGYDI